MDVDVTPIPAEYGSYRAEVRDFITAHAPRLRTKTRNGHRTPEYPEDVTALKVWIRALYDAGYHLAGNPEPDPVKLRILREEIGASGFPTLLGNAALLTALERFGTHEQKTRYLPRIYCGDYVLCQLFSEPEAGSDLASLQTRAERVGDDWVIHGHKTWTTYGQWADYGLLLARTDPHAEKHQGISAFVLPMRQPGVEVKPMRMCVGTSDFNEVTLDGARVPADSLLGTLNDGWKLTLATLFGERSAIFVGGSDHAADGEGGTRGAVMELLQLAAVTSRNGKPLLEDSAWRQRLGDLYAQALVQTLSTYRAMTRAAQQASTPADAPLNKILGSEFNLKLSETALAILGPASVLIEGDPRAHRDGYWQDRYLYARALMIGGGTGEVMRNIIAERALGLPK